MMVVYARGENHDARLVALLACLVLFWLMKKPVRYIPGSHLIFYTLTYLIVAHVRL